MSRLKHENPFAMGNLGDLMTARENNDMEYLKEWSKKAVEVHEKAVTIQLKAYSKLIEANRNLSNSVEEVKKMLEETHSSSRRVIKDE